MFVGRVGVLTFGFALLERQTSQSLEPVKDDLAI
jgi:trk system potassium uptake protein TrkH